MSAVVIAALVIECALVLAAIYYTHRPKHEQGMSPEAFKKMRALEDTQRRMAALSRGWK